jgi:hypothetical protein
VRALAPTPLVFTGTACLLVAAGSLLAVALGSRLHGSEPQLFLWAILALLASIIAACCGLAVFRTSRAALPLIMSGALLGALASRSFALG